MTTYDLSRLTILLVDDHPYIRKVMREVLKALGVGQVLTAESGVEAIEAMKSGDNYYGQMVDLVISDLIMSPVDGLLLLRWVRQGRDSPNRFLPFIMMSGAADSEKVHQARDAGASEFLAKPFSAASVAERILQVIDRPRQFVATTDYFGPDRKRKGQEQIDEERRKRTEKDVTIVYSADKVVRPKSDSDVYFFRLPNRLKEKVGGLGAGGAGALPMDHLAEADAHLERKALEFHDWAVGYLATLSRLCDRALSQPEAARRDHFRNINLLAHELRGQGGTFGYPLITQVGKMLFQATHATCPTGDTAVEIVKAHIDTMRTVFGNKITGDGGRVGIELMTSMKQAIRKVVMEGGDAAPGGRTAPAADRGAKRLLRAKGEGR